MTRRLVAPAVLAAMLARSVFVAPEEKSLTDTDQIHARRRVIGRSVRGRPIRAYRIGDRSSRHTVLVVGCIHGNECAGRAILATLRDMAPFNDLDLWLVFSMNPDGTAAGTRQTPGASTSTATSGASGDPSGSRGIPTTRGPGPSPNPNHAPLATS